MGWVRDASGCSGQYDGSVVIAQERYILGGGMDPIAVAVKPTSFLGGDDGNTPLPGFGSSHPSAPLLRLDSYGVETDGGVATIVARYSTDGRFSLPAPPTVGRSFRWRATTENYVFSLPWAARTTDVHYAPQAEGAQGPPTPVERYRWVYLKENFLVKAQRISMSLRIKDENILPALETLYRYQSMAMPINGRVWVFEGGDVDEAGSSDDYRMQLNFLRESDIKLDYQAFPLNTWWPKVEGKYPQQTGEFAKPAYHKTVILMPEGGDVATAPGFDAIPSYEFAADGFEALSRLVP